MPNCNNCESKKTENLEPPVSVPYFVYEGQQERNHKKFKMMFVLILILIFLLVGTNVSWLIYESQFETVETVKESYEIDASEGGNAIANGEGSVIIGESDLH